MNKPAYHALVVDDELLVRRLTARALVDEGFQCTEAADGNAALAALKSGRFDVVVTDLRMPNKNGHALAVELLEMNDHPQIVVLTGCIEPRLATDLLNRGVADVLFKPIDFAVLAVKVRRAVDLRGTRIDEAAGSERPSSSTGTRPSVSPVEIERKLSLITQILPVANVESELQRRAQSATVDVADLAVLLERDPALIVETLRLANAAEQGPSAPKVGTVKDAVARIGRKRIAELAVASAAVRNTWSLLIPWLDRNVLRQRSLAAGIALERMVVQGGHRGLADGLALCARAHALGRVVLGMLFSGHYEVLLKSSSANGDALANEERELFEMDHAQVMARLFDQWKLPRKISLTFQHILEPYSSLASHSEELRKRIELVKIAVLAAKLVVGRWSGWDLIEVPTAKALSQLRVESLEHILDETRDEMIRQGELPPYIQPAVSPLQNHGQRIRYSNLSSLSCDVVGHFLATTGIDVALYADGSKDDSRPVVLSCLGDAATGMADRVQSIQSHRRIIVCDHRQREVFSPFGDVVTLPASADRLLSALKPLPRKADDTPAAAESLR